MTTNTVELAIPQERISAIEAGRAALVANAQALIVDSLETEEVAWAVVNAIGELRKTIAADFASAKKASHAAWKAVCAQEAGHLDALAEPDQIVRGKLSAWEAEKRRRQAEQERIAREKARAEAQALADEEARKRAEEERLQQAIAAEEAGKAEEAKALLEQPLDVAPAEVPPEAVPIVLVAPAPKVSGAGAMVEVWHFEVTDPTLVPREYLIVNEIAVGKVVAALKGQANIPGVRVWSALEPRRTGRRA